METVSSSPDEPRNILRIARNRDVSPKPTFMQQLRRLDKFRALFHPEANRFVPTIL
jgi:hypothetical protein